MIVIRYALLVLVKVLRNEWKRGREWGRTCLFWQQRVTYLTMGRLKSPSGISSFKMVPAREDLQMLWYLYCASESDEKSVNYQDTYISINAERVKQLRKPLPSSIICINDKNSKYIKYTEYSTYTIAHFYWVSRRKVVARCPKLPVSLSYSPSDSLILLNHVHLSSTSRATIISCSFKS